MFIKWFQKKLFTVKSNKKIKPTMENGQRLRL